MNDIVGFRIDQTVTSKADCYPGCSQVINDISLAIITPEAIDEYENYIDFNI